MRELSFSEKLVNILYPRRCPICDRPVYPQGALICPECAEIPVKVTGSTCRKCGKPLLDEDAEYCPDCRKTEHVFAYGAAVFDYHSISSSLYRFKYKGRAEYAAWYGEQMADRLEELTASEGWEPGTLVPVPIHKKRLDKRGYNQAALLVSEIAARTGLPADYTVLSRTVNTEALRMQSLESRRNSLKNAFLAHKVADNSKSIIIVDDIFTTGATIDACAAALYGAGASSVRFLTLAIGEAR